MTEPYNLDDDEVMLYKRRRPSSWIERVRAADADAENAWRLIMDGGGPEDWDARALTAIAAELRAARIARRPGAGQ